MKRLLTMLSFAAAPLVCFAQRPHTYDVVGLPDGGEIAEALKIGLPFIIGGVIVAWLSLKLGHNEKGESKGGWFGCLGLISVVIGIIALIPLFAWMEAIVVSIVTVVGVVALIVLIVKSIKK